MSTSKKIIVSVIIPVYNEQAMIIKCVQSLLKQSFKDFEIILVDDGSDDKSKDVISKLKKENTKVNFTFLSQNHLGPGVARNRGAKHSSGQILVFVDADMEFAESFLLELTKPILRNNAIGTDSQSEFLANPHNYWALCWNMGRFSAAGVINNTYKTNMVPDSGNSGGVFRAIRKDKFEKVGGFELGGDYTDDESLSRRIGIKATLSNKAIFFHYNPETFNEVFSRAYWIGSSKRFTQNYRYKLKNMVKFALPVSFIKGLLIGLKFRYLKFLGFKLIYDFAIWWAIIKSI